MDENTTEIKRDCDRAAVYAFNGKVMLVSAVLLFAVCAIVVCFHVYVKRCIFRNRRRHHGFRFNSDSASNLPTVSPHGLDPSVLKSLPIFVYSSSSSSNTHRPDTALREMGCSVCLCEFQDNEKGRVLPGCSHCFHVECIDMWFQSHSNCPVCRAPVQLQHLVKSPLLVSTENRPEPGVAFAEPTQSAACQSWNQHCNQIGSRSSE